MDDNGKADKDAHAPTDEAPAAPTEVGGSPQPPEESQHRSIPMRAGPDLILDERLTSAAAPFLYLLAIFLIAVAGYFAYVFLRA